MSQFQPYPSSTFAGSSEQPATDTADAAEESQPRSKAKSRPRTPGKALDKASVRRVAAKVLEVEKAGNRTLAVVASLLGSANDTVELTVAIMSADRAATQPIKDIRATFEEAKEDQIMAVLGLNAASAAQIKAMWSTMTSLNGSTRSLPSNERAALNELFKMITGMTEEHLSLLNSASNLLHRA